MSKYSYNRCAQQSLLSLQIPVLDSISGYRLLFSCIKDSLLGGFSEILHAHTILCPLLTKYSETCVREPPLRQTLNRDG